MPDRGLEKQGWELGPDSEWVRAGKEKANAGVLLPAPALPRLPVCALALPLMKEKQSLTMLGKL